MQGGLYTQYTMWKTHTKRIDDRIKTRINHTSDTLSKAKQEVPSDSDRSVRKQSQWFIHINEIPFDNFNESLTLKSIAEKYKENLEAYPEVVGASKIYQTRDNKSFCKKLYIRLSGKPLGRSKSDPDEAEDKSRKEDFLKRLEIEGVIDVAKTRYDHDKLMTRLPISQKASIGLVFFV